MRITLVSPFDPYASSSAHGGAHVGGVERVFAEVSSRLARRGHDVTLVCSSDGKIPGGLEGGVQVVRVRRSGMLLRAPVAALHRNIPADADIVHVPATYPFTTASVLQRAKARGIPSVLDFHFEPAPGSLLAHLAASAYRWVGPPSYRHAHAVMVRSHAYARGAPSLSAIPEDRWRIVPNGIDPERFSPDGPTVAGDYLLFVGRLVPYKGVDVLLRAMARVTNPVPLVIAGDGPLRATLEKQAQSLGIDVRFLGRVPDDGLPPLYRGASLTVLPSVNRQEAFGISLIESMACGTPVVATKLPGVEDVARLGGLVAEPRDPEDLAAQIVRARDPGLLPRGAELAERIHRRFSWDAVTDRVLAVYEEVTGDGNTQRRKAG